MARDTTLNVDASGGTPGTHGKPIKRVTIPLGITLEGRKIMIQPLNANTEKRELEVANRIRRHLLGVFGAYKKTIITKKKGKKT